MRRKAASKRPILKDPLLASILVTKLVNMVMCHGKRSVAEKIVYGAFQTVVGISGKADKDEEADGSSSTGPRGLKKRTLDIYADIEARKFALDIFEKALQNLYPVVEVKARRVGGANYQVPVEVRSDRQLALALRWLVASAAQRSGRTMALRLAHEILDASQNKGNAVKKREDVHKMANANRAFAHYRW